MWKWREDTWKNEEDESCAQPIDDKRTMMKNRKEKKKKKRKQTKERKKTVRNKSWEECFDVLTALTQAD